MKYKVVFNPNGGTVHPTYKTTSDKGKLSGMPTPRYGSGDTLKIFTGWYTSATGGDFVSYDHIFTSATTIYAHWADPPADGRAHFILAYMGGTIDFCEVQSVKEQYTSTLNATPIVTYGFKRTFCLDAGVTRNITVSYKRVSGQDGMTNHQWAEKLLEAMNRWQMLSNGFRAYYIVPDDVSEMYPQIEGVNCYISQASVQNDNVMTFSDTVSLKVGTIYPGTEEDITYRTAHFYKDATLVMDLKFQLGVSVLMPEFPTASLEDDELFSCWTYNSVEYHPGDKVALPDGANVYAKVIKWGIDTVKMFYSTDPGVGSVDQWGNLDITYADGKATVNDGGTYDIIAVGGGGGGGGWGDYIGLFHGAGGGGGSGWCAPIYNVDIPSGSIIEVSIGTGGDGNIGTGGDGGNTTLMAASLALNVIAKGGGHGNAGYIEGLSTSKGGSGGTGGARYNGSGDGTKGTIKGDPSKDSDECNAFPPGKIRDVSSKGGMGGGAGGIPYWPFKKIAPKDIHSEFDRNISYGSAIGDTGDEAENGALGSGGGGGGGNDFGTNSSGADGGAGYVLFMKVS